MKILVGILVFASLLVLFGCIEPQQPIHLVGNDTDAHGCIPSAGYTWCDAKQKCIRPWEENCTAPILVGNDSDIHGCKASAGYTWCEASQKCIRSFEENCTAPILVGNDSDIHGCKASAGYTWCEVLQKCIRPWEENCTSSNQQNQTANQSLVAAARTYCGAENVANVFICGEYIRVVSSLIGGGSKFYKDNQLVTQCPVVGPDSMSDQCKLLLLGNNCVEQEVICNQMPGSDRDAHGCIPSAGYSWCDAKQKCIRSWEENCTVQ